MGDHNIGISNETLKKAVEEAIHQGMHGTISVERAQQPEEHRQKIEQLNQVIPVLVNQVMENAQRAQKQVKDKAEQDARKAISEVANKAHSYWMSGIAMFAYLCAMLLLFHAKVVVGDSADDWMFLFGFFGVMFYIYGLMGMQEVLPTVFYLFHVEQDGDTPASVSDPQERILRNLGAWFSEKPLLVLSGALFPVHAFCSSPNWSQSYYSYQYCALYASMSTSIVIIFIATGQFIRGSMRLTISPIVLGVLAIAAAAAIFLNMLSNMRDVKNYMDEHCAPKYPVFECMGYTSNTYTTPKDTPENRHDATEFILNSFMQALTAFLVVCSEWAKNSRKLFNPKIEEQVMGTVWDLTLALMAFIASAFCWSLVFMQRILHHLHPWLDYMPNTFAILATFMIFRMDKKVTRCAVSISNFCCCCCLGEEDTTTGATNNAFTRDGALTYGAIL